MGTTRALTAPSNPPDARTENTLPEYSMKLRGAKTVASKVVPISFLASYQKQLFFGNHTNPLIILQFGSCALSWVPVSMSKPPLDSPMACTLTLPPGPPRELLRTLHVPAGPPRMLHRAHKDVWKPPKSARSTIKKLTNMNT